MHKNYAFVLDVGTTGVKAFVFDSTCNVIRRVYKPLRKSFPRKNWVEQDPFELLVSSRKALEEARQECGLSSGSLFGIGITNQRETTVLWDKTTGIPVSPAIVWEDTRMVAECRAWQDAFGDRVRKKTGLPIDSYFSAPKIWWILKNNAHAQKLLAERRLVFGTVDSWILWNFAEDNPHVTDYTNAARTLLFNIQTLAWDDELLDMFSIPREILPRVSHSKNTFGGLRKDILGFPLPILAVCGDQQASLYAAGSNLGTTKVTFGTGTFLMQVIGSAFALHEGFTTTLTGDRKQPTYALEARIGFYGTEISDVIGDTRRLREAEQRAADMVGDHVRRLPQRPDMLVVDGGVTQDADLLRIQQDAVGIPVHRQEIFDGTALGVAKLLFGR